MRVFLAGELPCRIRVRRPACGRSRSFSRVSPTSVGISATNSVLFRAFEVDVRVVNRSVRSVGKVESAAGVSGESLSGEGVARDGREAAFHHDGCLGGGCTWVGGTVQAESSGEGWISASRTVLKLSKPSMPGQAVEKSWLPSAVLSGRSRVAAMVIVERGDS